MGGDDFQKDGSELNLRAAIAEARQTNDDAASARARKLFDEMGIIEAVTATIQQGNSEVDIPFPDEIQAIQVESKYSGEISWSDVIERFSSLVMAEDVQIDVHTMLHGCCENPRGGTMQEDYHKRENYNGRMMNILKKGYQKCRNCNSRYSVVWNRKRDISLPLITFQYITLKF